MAFIYFDTYQKKYFVNYCSLAMVFVFVLTVVSILLPLFAVYATDDFWQRVQEYAEHPIVKLTDQYFNSLTVNGKEILDITNNKLKSFYIQTALNNTIIELKDGKVIFNEYTTSNSYKAEKINVKFNYQLGTSRPINFKSLLLFQYGLNDKVRLFMNSMTFINFDFPYVTTNFKYNVKLSGFLNLKQKSPLAISSIPLMQSDKSDINRCFEKEIFQEYNDNDMLYFYNQINKKNYSLSYDFEKKIEMIKSDSNIVEIDMDIYIPKLQKVLYYESVLESLRNAWKQYFYIFIPIYLIIFYFVKIIIEKGIFDMAVKSDI